MQLQVDLAWVTATFLMSIRMGMIFVMAPVFGTVQAPSRARVLFVIALSAMIVSSLGETVPAAPVQVGELVLAALGELLVGGLFAFGLFAGFGVFLFGGRLLDMQIGFGFANLVDPATRHQSPLIGTALNLLAVFIFFAVDGHHMILRGIAFSLERIPLGAFNGVIDPAALIAMFGSMFTFGMALVAPVVFCLFLIDVGMAVISRTMPQLNIFFLGMGVKVMAGLLLLAVSTQYMAPLMSRVFTLIFSYWEKVLG